MPCLISFYALYVIVTGIVCEPPVSLPYTVIVEETLDVNAGLGVNVNPKPLTTCAVVVISSPKNTGTEPAADAPCVTANVPALWSANTTVYPAFVFPCG